MARVTVGKGWLWIAGLFAFSVIACVAGKYISVFSTHVINDQEKWGQFGDYFGGVLNPILSFFALIALLVTLRTQIAANEAGERRHAEQLREQRLFQLIVLMNDSALSTKVVAATEDGYAYGHQAQHCALIRLRESLARRVRMQNLDSTDLDVFQSVEEKFKDWRRDYWGVVGVYIDSVFLVLDFVIRDESSESFKLFAFKALRIQLSESERLLVWYTAMFTAEYVIYLELLTRHGFVDDHEGSLDDQLKPFREKMIACSRIWSNVELQKRPAKAAASTGTSLS